MSDKKHIDRLFQEKLKNFEATPDDAIWDRINDELKKDKRKRRVIPIWWQLAGVAAALLLILTIAGVFNSDKEILPSNTIVETETPKTKGTDPNVNTVRDSNSSNDNLKLTEYQTEQKINGSTKYNSSTTEDNRIQLKSPTNIKESQNFKLATKTQSKDNRSKTVGTNPNLQKNRSAIALKNKTHNNEASSSPFVNSKEKKAEAIVKTKKELNEIIKNKKKSLADSNTDSTKENTTSEQTENKVLETKKEDISIEEAIAALEEDTSDEKEEEKLNRWSVAPNVAPVYFNALGKGSSIHDQFNNNTRSGDINMSFGIAGGYAINKKFKIKAGVNKVNLGYSTNDVVAYNSRLSSSSSSSGITPSDIVGVDEIRNVSFSADSTNTYVSAQALSLESAPEIVRTTTKASLEQQLEFIEIPVELEYKLLDKKLDINLVGGFSTMFLSNNEVFAVAGDNRELVGEANNINSVSYSANIGLGFNYSLSKKIDINLEPKFKYQINTFNNTSGNFQPYVIGVYTGMSFKF